MQAFQQVLGCESSARRLVLDKDTVYVHTNIMQDEENWVYDEIQYSYDEFKKN